MRVAVCESFHRFDLPEGSRHHEDINPNDATGVDLEIGGSPAVWLEVKNYEAPTIPAPYRERQREKFERDVAGEGFWPRIVAKFVGTDALLRGRGERPAAPVLALVLRCDRLRLADLGTFTSILERHLAQADSVRDGRAAVLPLGELSDYLAGTYVNACDLSGPGDCMSPIHRCSVRRQSHRL